MAKCNSVTEWRKKCRNNGTMSPIQCGCNFCIYTCDSGAMTAPMQCQCEICLSKLYSIGFGKSEDDPITNIAPKIEKVDLDNILRVYVEEENLYLKNGRSIIYVLREETPLISPYYFYLIQSMKESYGGDYFDYLDKEFGVGTAERRVNELLCECDKVHE